MVTCAKCKRPVSGDYPRLAAGTVLSTGERVKRHTNLHPDCLGPWFLEHYPWMVTVHPH